MADKVLNLKLKYKDKVLDIVRQNRDFTKKFYIGNDRDLFWQILDKAFPKRFNLISKMGSSFKMNLLDDMNVIVRKDNQELGMDDLKRANLIKGKILTLDPSTTGSIDFGESWEIEYSFSRPYTYALSVQEINIAKQFAKFPPSTPQQKFTRIFIILGLIATWLGLFVVESTYIPPPTIDFAERMQRIEDLATQIQPDIVTDAEVESTTDTQVGKSREEMEEEVTEQVEYAQEMTSAQFEQEFGLSLDVGAGIQGGTGTGDFSNELLEVTVVSEVVAAGSGGPGTKARRGAADLDIAGSSGFDLEGTGDGLGGLGDMSGLDLGGTGGFEEVDMASLGGNVGSYNITKVKSKAQFSAVKKRFAGIKMVSEGSIKVKQTISPQTKSIVADIDRVVATYKPQISKLFGVESMMMDMYGTIEFSIIINKNSKVEAVDIDVIKGSYFTDSFLSKCREIIMNWKIPVNDPIGYSFRMKFMK